MGARALPGRKLCLGVSSVEVGDLLHHWSYDPLALCALVLAVWHEIGLRRLLRHTRRDRRRRRRLRSLWFYGGLAVVVLAVASPLEHWGYDYFYIHTLQHLLLMFVAPTLIVAGAPWQPLLVALPLRSRRRALRSLLHDDWSRSLRAAKRVLLRPLPIVLAFNALMLVWELPGPLDLAERDRVVHVWLMNGVMLATGVLFWLLIIASPPLRLQATRRGPGGRAAGDQLRDVRDRDGDDAVHAKLVVLGLRATYPAWGWRRSPTNTSAPGSCGCAAISGPCRR